MRRSVRPVSCNAKHWQVDAPHESCDAKNLFVLFAFHRYGNPYFVELCKVQVLAVLKLSRAILYRHVVQLPVGWLEQRTLAKEVDRDNADLAHRKFLPLLPPPEFPEV